MRLVGAEYFVANSEKIPDCESVFVLKVRTNLTKDYNGFVEIAWNGDIKSVY